MRLCSAGPGPWALQRVRLLLPPATPMVYWGLVGSKGICYKGIQLTYPLLTTSKLKGTTFFSPLLNMRRERKQKEVELSAIIIRPSQTYSYGSFSTAHPEKILPCVQTLREEYTEYAIGSLICFSLTVGERLAPFLLLLKPGFRV